MTLKEHALQGINSNPIEDAKRIEKSEIISTNKSNTTLTLLRNGNLIMWSPDSDNSNYYNNEKVFQEQVVLWSSKGEGGKTTKVRPSIWRCNQQYQCYIRYKLMV